MKRMLRYVSCLSLMSLCFIQGSVHAADKFKPFKLKTIEGTSKTLQDFEGKAILVSFFFPTCKYCNAEFPETQKMYDKYKDRGFAAVWINVVPEENKEIPRWQQEHQYTIPVLIGASMASLQRDYKLKVTPTHFLLDAQGNVLFSRAGYKEGDEKPLEEQIQKALGLTP